MASIITRTGKGSALTVPEMDSNFRNLNDQILRTNSRPTNIPVFRSDIVNSGVLDPRVTFTRNSTGTYYDKFGVLRTAASGVPRIDYDPITGECKGLLVEPAATNLLSYSEQFDNAVWGKYNTTVYPNSIISPDGSLTADKIVATSGSNNFYFGFNNNSEFTASIFAKSAGYNLLTISYYNFSENATFNLDTGEIVSGFGASIQYVGNGWYRCSVSEINQHVTLGDYIAFRPSAYTNGINGIYIWGAQLEAGSTPTSYIPTTSAAVTRQADIVKIPSTFTSSRVANSATLQVEAKSSNLTTNQTYSTIKSNTSPITQKLIKQTQSKNLLTNSENFSVSPWTVSNVTIIATTTPNPLTESQTVWKLVDTITSAIHSVYYNVTTGLTIAKPYTYSVYAKASGRDYFALRWNADTSRDAIFSLTTGTIISADSAIQATIRNIGSGWYRCAITVRPTSTSSRIDFFTSANSTLTAYAGDAVSGTLLFGAQLEADEKPTKYVPEPGYSVQLNSITPTQVYGDGKDITKFDRFAITTNGSTVSYAANGKIVGSESVTINQISDIVIGSDSSDLNQINGHVQKIALYNTQVTTEQLINLSS